MSFSFKMLVPLITCFCLHSCEQNSSRIAETPAAPAVLAHQAAQKPDLDFLMGKFDPTKHSDFATVNAPYTDKPGMMLQKEAAVAFEKMWQKAKSEGLTLKIISATRTFAQQKKIWETKWARFATEAPEAEARAKKIMEYSAMPGASRHHWGTDIDLNDLNNSAFETGGKHEKVYAWLQKHAHEFGFCQPYTAGRPFGYKEEKWHWTYTPISQKFWAQCQSDFKDQMISGFTGSETAVRIGILQHYINGINANCQKSK